MKVAFKLPTPEEDDWKRTGRGFEAIALYKAWKKGESKTKTITVQVQVQDDKDIDSFLDDLTEKCKEDLDKVKDIAGLDDFANRLQLGSPEKFSEKLQTIKDTYKRDSTLNQVMSEWLEAARASTLYPFTSSKDETDAEAIAESSMAPKDCQDEDGDLIMDD